MNNLLFLFAWIIENWNSENIINNDNNNNNNDDDDDYNTNNNNNNNKLVGSIQAGCHYERVNSTDLLNLCNPRYENDCGLTFVSLPWSYQK